MRNLPKKVLITDIDNTLFDWFSMWHDSFSAMMEAVANISGISQDILLHDAKLVHQKHGTSEYAFLLEELPCLKDLYGTKENILRELAGAISIYRKVRDEKLVLYDGVMGALCELKNRGVKIYAFSESKEYYSSYRIFHLGLDGVLDALYCPEDHEIPEGKLKTNLLIQTKCNLLPGAFKKPNKEILLKILESQNIAPESALYVGDSKAKDIKMAVDADIDYLWFSEGANHINERVKDYNLLRAVTHWSEGEVAEERRFAESMEHLPVDANCIISSYNSLLTYFG